jgi:hypothetical protein
VTLSPEQQAKLARLAQERGTDAQATAREAIERLLDYDDRFMREVEKGLSQRRPWQDADPPLPEPARLKSRPTNEREGKKSKRAKKRATRPASP